MIFGVTCAPGGTTTSAFTQNNATAEFIRAALNGWNVVGTNCGTATGGIQAPTNDLLVRTGVVKGSGTAKNLHCWLGTAPGGTTNNVFTVFQSATGNTTGGSATALTCTITGTAFDCKDNTHTFAVAAGDMLSIGRTATAGSPALSQTGGCVFEIVY